MFYSLSLYMPKFTISLPKNTKSILTYSLYILLAGSAASILIDIVEDYRITNRGGKGVKTISIT